MVFSATPWPLVTPGKDAVPTVQEAGWAPGPVWTGAENVAPTGIRSPDRPARIQSLPTEVPAPRDVQYSTRCILKSPHGIPVVSSNMTFMAYLSYDMRICCVQYGVATCFDM